MGGGNKAARQNEGGRQERFPTSALLTRTGGATHSTHGVPWMQKQSLGFPTVTVGQRMGTFWYPPQAFPCPLHPQAVKVPAVSVFRSWEYHMTGDPHMVDRKGTKKGVTVRDGIRTQGAKAGGPQV